MYHGDRNHPSGEATEASWSPCADAFLHSLKEVMLLPDPAHDGLASKII